MKLGIMSDLHLEFGQIDKTIPEVDVMILAGDILVATDIGTPRKGQRYDKFADMISERSRHVLYIPGNHEYYHMYFEDANARLMHWCEEHEFTWLTSANIEGQHFIGCTLWTDGGDAADRAIAAYSMNDYRVIRYGDDTLGVDDTRRFHQEQLYFLEQNVREGSIVVTHHLPSYESIDEKFKYAGQGVNAAYASHLDSFIEAAKPALWIHGHSHSPKDYMIGNTRIISNPRGYIGYEDIADDFEIMVIEI